MKYLLLCFLFFNSTTDFAQSNQNNSYQEIDPISAKLQKFIGKEISQFSAISDNGIIYTNDSLKGKVTLVNLWFEACAPCVAEFATINNLFTKFKDNKNFQILAFTFEKPEAIKTIKEKYHLRYELISIPREQCYILNFKTGFPTNMIIDQSSKITYIRCGGPNDRDHAEKYFNTTFIPEINKLLGDK